MGNQFWIARVGAFWPIEGPLATALCVCFLCVFFPLFRSAPFFLELLQGLFFFQHSAASSLSIVQVKSFPPTTLPQWERCVDFPSLGRLVPLRVFYHLLFLLRADPPFSLGGLGKIASSFFFFQIQISLDQWMRICSLPAGY